MKQLCRLYQQSNGHQKSSKLGWVYFINTYMFRFIEISTGEEHKLDIRTNGIQLNVVSPVEAVDEFIKLCDSFASNMMLTVGRELTTNEVVNIESGTLVRLRKKDGEITGSLVVLRAEQLSSCVKYHVFDFQLRTSYSIDISRGGDKEFSVMVP